MLTGIKNLVSIMIVVNLVSGCASHNLRSSTQCLQKANDDSVLIEDDSFAPYTSLGAEFGSPPVRFVLTNDEYAHIKKLFIKRYFTNKNIDGCGISKNNKNNYERHFKAYAEAHNFLSYLEEEVSTSKEGNLYLQRSLSEPLNAFKFIFDDKSNITPYESIGIDNRAEMFKHAMQDRYSVYDTFIIPDDLRTYSKYAYIIHFGDGNVYLTLNLVDYVVSPHKECVITLRRDTGKYNDYLKVEQLYSNVIQNQKNFERLINKSAMGYQNYLDLQERERRLLAKERNSSRSNAAIMNGIMAGAREVQSNNTYYNNLRNQESKTYNRMYQEQERSRSVQSENSYNSTSRTYVAQNTNLAPKALTYPRNPNKNEASSISVNAPTCSKRDHQKSDSGGSYCAFIEGHNLDDLKQTMSNRKADRFASCSGQLILSNHRAVSEVQCGAAGSSGYRCIRYYAWDCVAHKPYQNTGKSMSK